MKTLRYALRHLTRARAYTLISLSGLAFSLACSIILLRYIHRELTVDANCIHPETVVLPLADVHGNWCPSARMYMDSVYLADGQVTERCLVVPNERTHILYENRTYNADMLAVDSTFFRFFAYPVVAGTVAMQGSQGAILTRKFAEQLFGRENPLGKVLVYDGISVVVQGVIDSPSNKTVWQFDVLVSRGLQDWNRMSIEMVRVLPGVGLDAINKVSGIYRDTKYSGPMRYRFIPWKQFYFDPSIVVEKSLMNHGDKSYLLILSGVIILLLAVGILNFINLYMVMLVKRWREYGVKKVLGLKRSSLFVEIWLENFALVFASLFVAWVLIEVTAVPVERLLGEPVSYTWFDGWLSSGILVALPLLTSAYPYIKYGYRSPVVSMRNVPVRYSVASRAVLLGIQYVFTVVLVVLSVYFNRHFDFLINTPPGFRTEGILEADLQKENWNYGNETDERRKSRNERIERIRKALDECPYIDSWICSSFDEITSEVQINYFNEKDKKVAVKALFVPAAFFDFYGLKVLDGDLPDEIRDVTRSEIALNEEAMKLFGYADREEAFVRAETPIWMFFGADGSVKKGGLELMPVAAVIADCYFGKLTGGVQPIVYVISGGYERGKISIAVHPGKEKELLAYLRRTVKEIYGTEEFDHAWLADVVKEQYAHDRKIATVYSVFAFIAIVVSCMGLFGISLFDIRRRYREIAIRKVNGATLAGLYWLLGGKYLKVLLASFAAAVPLAWFIISRYTESFVLKAPLSAWIFIVALLLVGLISLGTLWWQVGKAARINPAEVMRSENN